MKLLIAWILLTLPIIIFVTGILCNAIKLKVSEDKETAKTLIFLIFCIWWSIYFLIS